MKRAVFALLVGVVLGFGLMERAIKWSIPTWCGNRTIGISADLSSVAVAFRGISLIDGAVTPANLQERWQQALRRLQSLNYLYFIYGYAGEIELFDDRSRRVLYGLTADGSDVYVSCSGSEGAADVRSGDPITVFGSGRISIKEGHYRTMYWPALRRWWPWTAAGLLLWCAAVCYYNHARRAWVPLLAIPSGAVIAGGAFMFDSPYWDLDWSQAGYSVCHVGCVVLGTGVGWALWPVVPQIGRLLRGVPPAHQCPSCGYDLSGIAAEICPECGTPVRPTPASPS